MYIEILLLRTVYLFFTILRTLIIVRAVMSWFRPRGYNKLFYDIERALDLLTEPVIAPIRRYLPPVGPGIDFSPLVAIILLGIIESIARQIILMVF